MAVAGHIELESAIDYRLGANVITECSNRTIMEKGNAMRFRAGLPPAYWEFSFRAAVYLGNRQPFRSREKTPWASWYGSIPDINHYKI